jgi:hypothetical protein
MIIFMLIGFYACCVPENVLLVVWACCSFYKPLTQITILCCYRCVAKIHSWCVVSAVVVCFAFGVASLLLVAGQLLPLSLLIFCAGLGSQNWPAVTYVVLWLATSWAFGLALLPTLCQCCFVLLLHFELLALPFSVEVCSFSCCLVSNFAVSNAALS